MIFGKRILRVVSAARVNSPRGIIKLIIVNILKVARVTV